MAVVSCEERVEPGDRDGAFGFTNETVVNRTFLVTTNSRDDNALTVMNSTIVTDKTGAFLSAHPDNPFYTRRTIQADSASPLHFVLHVPYSIAPISQDERERATVPNPLNRKVKMSVGSQEFQKYEERDLDGNLLMTSSREPYPAQVKEDSRPILRLRKAIPDFNVEWLDLNDTTNKDEVTVTDGVSTVTIPKETALIKRIAVGELQIENDVNHYMASCELHKRKVDDEWTELKLLDHGFKHLVGGEPRDITELVYDEDGTVILTGNGTQKRQKITTSVLLDGSGGRLAASGDPVFNDFPWREPQDWNQLSFFWS